MIIKYLKLTFSVTVGMLLMLHSMLMLRKYATGLMLKKVNSTWDNVRLQIRNQLTSTLHENWREGYRQWNNITMEAKLLLKDGDLKNISTFIQENKLNNCIYESVEWDLLTAMMEYAYSTYVKPGFHTELLEIYNSGHIPCGWKGKWPQGSLLIF